MAGHVYLLHFDAPLGHARHYRGWTLDVERRLREHASANGRSVPLMRALKAAGIGFVLAETREGDRHVELRLRRRGGAARTCPICRAERNGG